MGRLLTGRLVLATHNAGKLDEMRDLLRTYGVDVTSAGELGLPVPEETGTTFVENARIKALAAVAATGLPALADDSGLCVAALDGAPGVHTADWGGPRRDWSLAMNRVEQQLQMRGARSAELRRAAFMATLCIAWPDGHEEIFVGQAVGHLVWPPRGAMGHGYDPMFQPDGFTQTFGEMTPEEKHGDRDGLPGLSHRAQAFGQFRAACLVAR
jgi:XTP/dITP diphosphohydrolase